MELTVHDLVRLASPASVAAISRGQDDAAGRPYEPGSEPTGWEAGRPAGHGPPAIWPAWAKAALDAAPWAVVRRAAPVAGLVPIGVRGATRAERFAAAAPLSDIVERLRPEDLRARRPQRPHPIFETMQRLGDLLDATGCAWGPGGSAAYELASGRPTLTPDSDLDLILRCNGILEHTAIASLFAAAEASSRRVDILVETPAGGAALAEIFGGGDEILLRTASGPRFVRRADFVGAAAPC